MSKKGNVKTENLSNNMTFTPLFDFVLEKGVSVDAARLYGWMYRNRKTWKFTIMGAAKILKYSKGKTVRLMRELISTELVDRKFISVIPREYEYSLRKSDIEHYNESESPTLEPIEDTTKVQSCDLPFPESSISESSKVGTVNHTNLNQSNLNQSNTRPKSKFGVYYDKILTYFLTRKSNRITRPEKSTAKKLKQKFKDQLFDKGYSIKQILSSCDAMLQEIEAGDWDRNNKFKLSLGFLLQKNWFEKHADKVPDTSNDIPPEDEPVDLSKVKGMIHGSKL